MTEYRSKSYADNTRNTNRNHHNNNLSKSYSYTGPIPDQLSPIPAQYEIGPKLKKVVSTSNWTGLSDPELQRKKRVASYKAYSVEGKVKVGFKRSFRWIKDRFHLVLHGTWKS